jgi:biopolymer transport protein ExbD
MRADKEVPWEKLAQVISALHDAKIPVRLVTQPEEMTGTRNR